MIFDHLCRRRVRPITGLSMLGLVTIVGDAATPPENRSSFGRPRRDQSAGLPAAAPTGTYEFNGNEPPPAGLAAPSGRIDVWSKSAKGDSVWPWPMHPLYMAHARGNLAGLLSTPLYLWYICSDSEYNDGSGLGPALHAIGSVSRYFYVVLPTSVAVGIIVGAFVGVV